MPVAGTLGVGKVVARAFTKDFTKDFTKVLGKVFAGLALSLLLSLPSVAVASDGWFETPAQRAAGALEAGKYETLIDDAPDAYWEGIGRYGAGDAEGATEAFARALRERAGEDSDVAPDRVPSDAPDADALLYNLATATTRAGRAAEALPLFDELLERDPSNADARHNREIAARLAELDEAEGGEEGEPGGDREGEGETGEQRDEQAGGQRGEQGGEQGGEQADGQQGEQQGEDTERGEDAAEAPTAGEQAQGDRADGESDDSADVPEDDTDARDERQAEAEAALEAEREAERLTEQQGAAEAGEVIDGEENDDAVGEETRTLTEREQAIEQRLRSIDDDPSGLLRRRLEWNHRNEYPEVRDGVQPW